MIESRDQHGKTKYSDAQQESLLTLKKQIGLTWSNVLMDGESPP